MPSVCLRLTISIARRNSHLQPLQVRLYKKSPQGLVTDAHRKQQHESFLKACKGASVRAIKEVNLCAVFCEDFALFNELSLTLGRCGWWKETAKRWKKAWWLLS